MQYRNFGKTGIKVSALGFGTMRFPLLHDEAVDEERAILFEIAETMLHAVLNKWLQQEL